MVTMLLFTLPLAAAGTPVHPRRRDWAAAAASAVALILVLHAAPAAADNADPHTARLAVAVLAAASVAAVLTLAARHRGRCGPACSQLAAAALVATLAGLVKAVTDTLAPAGPVAVLTDWPVYALAVVAIAELAYEQQALIAGPLTAAQTTLTVATPVLGAVLGVLVFGERFSTTPSGLAAAAAGAVLAGGGVLVLARSPLLTAAGRQNRARPRRRAGRLWFPTPPGHSGCRGAASAITAEPALAKLGTAARGR